MSVVQLYEIQANPLAVTEECDTKWKAGYQLCGTMLTEKAVTLLFQLPVGASLGGSGSGGRLGPQPYAQAQQP